MYSPIDFDDDADFRTIKVDNVAIYWNLAAELQAQSSPISQYLPRCTLGTSVFMPHLTRSIRKFL